MQPPHFYKDEFFKLCLMVIDPLTCAVLCNACSNQPSNQRDYANTNTPTHRVIMTMSTKLGRSHNQWMVLDVMSSQTGTTPFQMNLKTDDLICICSWKKKRAAELQLRFFKLLFYFRNESKI